MITCDSQKRDPGSIEEDWLKTTMSQELSQQAFAVIQMKNPESQGQGTDLGSDKAFYGH